MTHTDPRGVFLSALTSDTHKRPTNVAAWKIHWILQSIQSEHPAKMIRERERCRCHSKNRGWGQEVEAEGKSILMQDWVIKATTAQYPEPMFRGRKETERHIYT